MKIADVIKQYYGAWERKNWDELAGLLANDFAFSSPNHDDHINTAAYKEKCWAGVETIDRYDIEKIIEHGNEAVALVRSRWKDGTTFRTAEYFKLKDGKVQEVESFWGFMPQDIAAMKEALQGGSS
jgi:ketosteroid isomerase-like protein